MSAAQILYSLPKLSNADLRQVSNALDAVFRALHQVVFDDEYGAMAEQDLVVLAGEAWSVIDGANKVPGIPPPSSETAGEGGGGEDLNC